MLSLDRYAEVCALVRHFSPMRDEVLERTGIATEEFSAAERYWTRSLLKASSEDDNASLVAFGTRFAAVRNTWRANGDGIEKIGGLPSAMVSPLHQASEKTAKIGLKDQPASKPSIEVAKPTYLLVDSIIWPTDFTGGLTVAEITETAVDADVVASELSTQEFLGKTAKATKRVPAVLMTEELPDPAAIARLIREAEPRAAFARSVSSPELHQSSAIPITAVHGLVEPAPDVDETMMLASPFLATAVGTGSFVDALTPLVVPTMSIGDYARLRASLRVHGEDDERTLRQFGIASLPVKEELQAEFAARFRAEPKLQTEFLELFESQLRGLRVGKP